MYESKFSNVMGRHMQAIMNNVKEKLTYLSVVTLPVLRVLQSEEGEVTSKQLGFEVMERIAEQIQLEEFYLHNMATNTVGGQGLHFNEEDAAETKESVYKNTRELCSKILRVPHFVPLLRNLQEERPTNLMKFIHALADLQEVMTVRMMTTAEESKLRKKMIEYYQHEKERSSASKYELEKQLAAIRSEREQKVSAKTKELLRLKAQLQDIHDSTKQRVLELENKNRSSEATETQEFEREHAEMSQTLKNVEDALQKKIFQSQKDEDAALKRSRQAQSDVERLLSKYSEGASSLQRDIDSLRDTCEATYARCRELTDELREHFSLEEEEAEEMLVEHERRALLQRIQEAQVNGANMLQSFWRGLRQREEYVELTKQKGKKKGKKVNPSKKGKST